MNEVRQPRRALKRHAVFRVVATSALATASFLVQVCALCEPGMPTLASASRIETAHPVALSQVHLPHLD